MRHGRANSAPDPSGARGDWRAVAHLAPYLRPFLGRILLALGCLLAAKAAGLGVPLILKHLVDDLAPGAGLAVIPLALLLAYGAARLAERLFSALRQIVFARVMARTSRIVMLRVFRHLHSLSLRFHLARRTGGVSRDVERGGGAIGDLLDWTLYTILPTLIEVVAVTCILVWLFDISFALIVLATLAAYVIWTIIVTEWRTRFYRASIEADTHASARAVDSLLNYETVKYFNNEEHEAQRYDENLQTMEETQIKSYKSLATLNVGQSAIVSIGVTALMWRAAAGVVAGEMTVGDLVLVNAYLLQLAVPLNLLGTMYRQVKQALTNLERLFNLLDESIEVRDPELGKQLPKRPPTIEFRAVNFSYDPRRQVLENIDFVLPAGGTIAAVGHSGSGKSTLARLLYRFYDVTAGAILIDGTDLREFSQDSLRQAIAIVPQDTVLFNDSIYYNILYGRPDASRDEVEGAARAAHIHDFIQSLPDGYETGVGERGLKLSGGEKQRVAIARALLKNPAILIFDEATSALDSKSEKSIQSELDRIQVGRTTLIIAHRLSTVMHADEILVLDHGRMIERGSHETLLARQGTYAQLWALQQRSETQSDGNANLQTMVEVH